MRENRATCPFRVSCLLPPVPEKAYNFDIVSDRRNLSAQPWFRRRCSSDAGGAEGKGGNAFASRAWKGNVLPAADFSAGYAFLSLPHRKRGLVQLMERLTDKFGRPITDLRIAITDRCNYKCVYCRTGNNGAQYAELPFADYARIARVFVGLGIE